MVDLTARIFTLIDLLQSRAHWTTRALADELGVSERTVRRDLVRLQMLDVPVEVTPGRAGGVRLPPGALLPPLRFTDAELLALVLGVKQLQGLGDSALRHAATRALMRLEAVLSETTRSRVAALGHALAQTTQTHTWSTTESAKVLALAEAIHQRRRLVLYYTSRDRQRTRRRVDPYGLVHLGHWYIAGYCHLRSGLRTFRLDRISSFTASDETFVRPENLDVGKLVADSVAQAPAQGPLLCQVRIAADLEQASRWLPAGVVVLEPEPAGVLLSVRTYPEQLEQVAWHLLALPWQLEVLGPAALKTAFATLAARALALSNPASAATN